MAGFEAVLKQAGEQGFFFTESNHTVADITRRQDVELAAQTTGTAAVIGDCDDGSDIDKRFAAFGIVSVFFEAVEQRREAGAAANGNDFERSDHADCAGTVLALTGQHVFERWQLGSEGAELGVLSREAAVAWLQVDGTS